MSFTFHANTLAFGGQLEDGRKTKYLPSQASVALPPGGGVGEATVTDYDDGGVSFYRAESRVDGSAVDDKYFTTYATVKVSRLDIDGRIQVGVMKSGVTSVNIREDDCTSESRISFEAQMLNLVIDGHLIQVDFDLEPFRRHGTFQEFVGSFGEMKKEEAEAYFAAYNWPAEECQTTTKVGEETVTQYHVPKRCTTGIRASILRGTTPSLAPGEILGITRKGFTIEVAGFGLVHLGEVLLKAGRRRINLLRVERGKTFEGSPKSRVSLASAGDEPRLRAIAMGETEELSGVVLSGGGYTFCSGEGNGTDFVP